MNYLAHLYLSKAHPDILIGNFIADFVKGKQYLKYPDGIQKGIILHRQIDTFSDQHHEFKRAKKLLNPKFRHYKGVIIDVLFDHFLAKNWAQYSSVSLDKFCFSFYQTFSTCSTPLPEQCQKVFFYMQKDQWLENYANTNGIEKVLIGMNQRTKNKSKMNEAITDLKNNYVALENCFFSFFIELEQFSDEILNNLLLENNSLK